MDSISGVRYRTDVETLEPYHLDLAPSIHGWFTVNTAMKRNRSAPHKLEDQISAYATRLKAEAADLPDGFRKNNLLEKIRQLEAASTMNAWLAPSE
jgi:hypothetical protein